MARHKLDKDLIVDTETKGLDLDELEVFRRNLRKEFGNSTALSDDDFETSFISTGIDPLDYLLGGGLPQGKMSEIVGLEGTGKSSFGIHMLSQVQKLGGLGVLIDTEGGAGDKSRLEFFGVDTKKCIVSVEDIAERAFAQIEKVANYIAKQNIKQPSLVILDSLAALVTQSELETEEWAKAAYPATARVIKTGINRVRMACRESNLALVFINQARITMGGPVNPYSGPSYSCPGGSAPKFACITRLFMERGKTLTTGEDKLKVPEGHIVKTKIIKCKSNGSLNRVLPMRLYYDSRGYCNELIIYDLLKDSGYFGSSAWKVLKICGDEHKFQNENDFIDIFNASDSNRVAIINLMKKQFATKLSLPNADSADNYKVSDGNIDYGSEE